jgi:hypothetical protein
LRLGPQEESGFCNVVPEHRQRRSGQIPSNWRPGPAGRGRRTTGQVPWLDFGRSLEWWGRRQGLAVATTVAGRVHPALAKWSHGSGQGQAASSGEARGWRWGGGLVTEQRENWSSAAAAPADHGGPTARGQAVARDGRDDDPLYRRRTRLQAPSELTIYLGMRATGRRRTDRRSKAWCATGE